MSGIPQEMTRGYVLKLNRAVHHLAELVTRSNEWFTPDRYSVIHEKDPEGAFARRVRIRLNEPLPSDAFSVIIGDTLYSLRSALDNLAFDLNGGTATAQALANESEFPIFGNENRAGNAVDGAKAHLATVRRKIRGMSGEARAIVEQLQPYNQGSAYRQDFLWLLNQLCNIDKHRKLHAVAGAYGGIAIRPDHCVNFSGRWEYWSHTGPLAADTVLARYTPVPTDLTCDVHVDLQPMLNVGFADGPASGVSAQFLLSRIHGHIVENVVKPLEAFL